MKNRFFVIPRDSTSPVPWNVHAAPPRELPVDCSYFGAVLAGVDSALREAGLRFYLIWDLDCVPAVGSDVVVFLIGDERYQVPACAGQVLAVFRTGAQDLFMPRVRTLTLLKALDAARSARDLALRARRWPRTRHVDSRARATVFPVPLGYHKQVPVPFKPQRERSTDVFFAGDLGAPIALLKPRSWTARPKNAARAAMARALREFQHDHPHVRCEAVDASKSGQLGPEAYSERLMDARISLCPRGNFPETFRFLESARAGAVIVCDPQPPTWYCREHPGVVLRDWRELPQTLEWLLADPEQLAKRQTETLRWWANVAGEQALARFVTSALVRLRS
jgi:hypothetical protein